MAEFAVVGSSAWYDISAIPPGPGNCKSFADCKAMTGKKGFNVPMSITPKINSGTKVPTECKAITCTAEGCTDAYLYPSDDLKTHNCPTTGVEFTVAFCPNGSSSASSSTTTTPASTTTAPATTTSTSTSTTLSEVGADYQSGVVSAGTSAPSAASTTSTATTTSAQTSSGNSTSLTGATIKSSFSYKGVLAGNVAGTYNMVTATNSCSKKTVSLNSPVGPLSEEVSMVFRGPMEIYNIAVFTATTNSDWSKVSSYNEGNAVDNMVFMNNLNIDYTTSKKSPQGFASANGAAKASSATTFSGKLAEATNPSNTYGGAGVATGAEVNIMLPKKCSEDGTCKGYYDDNGYHGWDGGKKMFVTKVKMPNSGSSPNQPAIWMLNAQVLRSGQYGCNCRGSGAVGGCGELDIAEVIETNTAKDKVSTHYYFYDGSHPAGGDNFAARPSDAATTYVTIIDDSGEGTIKVLEIGGDDFDFTSSSISADTVSTWLSASDKNLISR